MIGLQDVSAIADDIKNHGSTQIEHYILLLETLDRCKLD